VNDRDLIVFGCAVAFIALCGIYVFIRDRFDN
jgi:hypothetical protein